MSASQSVVGRRNEADEMYRLHKPRWSAKFPNQKVLELTCSSEDGTMRLNPSRTSKENIVSQWWFLGGVCKLQVNIRQRKALWMDTPFHELLEVKHRHKIQDMSLTASENCVRKDAYGKQSHVLTQFQVQNFVHTKIARNCTNECMTFCEADI